MGFTGLARWINAPTTGLDLIKENIIRNHNGQYRGRWQLTIRSYRSTLGGIPGLQIHSERSMCALSMNENVFVLLEDPSAPMRSDIPMEDVDGNSAQTPQPIFEPPHYRTTFITLRPSGALEQLMSHLRSRWVSVRQSASASTSRGQTAGQQLAIDGNVFAIGNDWLVRVGNVILAGGAVKGMLLEAEYLPLPVLQSQAADGTSELLSNLLTSVLPNVQGAKTVAVTISDSQWEEVLWDREEEKRNKEESHIQVVDPDSIYAYGDDFVPTHKKGDWIGVDRDRRSAFLIIGALKSEGIL